jgi:hypothetical protein
MAACAKSKHVMIVCSCSLISAKEVADAVTAIRAIEPLAKLKPGRVYRYLGKHPACGGCGRLLKELIAFYDPDRTKRAWPVANGRKLLGGVRLKKGAKKSSIFRDSRTVTIRQAILMLALHVNRATQTTSICSFSVG